ncbi:hypothetical protein, partial [Endozoicomonas sp. YOMI1]|uniref:hypothetical protein n=1 Tax=Endozoicomonas sp. YOMI1 TaxID=2828739 RepID=UPI002147BA06
MWIWQADLQANPAPSKCQQFLRKKGCSLTYPILNELLYQFHLLNMGCAAIWNSWIFVGIPRNSPAITRH